MARQLWMLRHGEAVPHDSKPDDDRELTPRGRRQAEEAGKALAAINEEFAACYTSPKVRAVETAFAHRDAEAMVIGGLMQPENATVDDVDRALAPWQSIARHGIGAYVNFQGSATADSANDEASPSFRGISIC